MKLRHLSNRLDWFQSFLQLHFLSFFITPRSCICLFNPIHCFTAETTLSFPLRDITYQIITSFTRLYTFEKKIENVRKDRVWRQTSNRHNSVKQRRVDIFIVYLLCSQMPQRLCSQNLHFRVSHSALSAMNLNFIYRL